LDHQKKWKEFHLISHQNKRVKKHWVLTNLVLKFSKDDFIFSLADFKSSTLNLSPYVRMLPPLAALLARRTPHEHFAAPFSRNFYLPPPFALPRAPKQLKLRNTCIGTRKVILELFEVPF
jgi:hypothetical protein